MNVLQKARLKTATKKHMLFMLVIIAAAYAIWEVRNGDWLFPALLGIVILGVFFERKFAEFVARNEHRLFLFELKHMLANEERMLLANAVKLITRSQELVPSESERTAIETLWQTGEQKHRWDVIVRTIQSSVYVLQKQADSLRPADATRRACRHQLREKRRFLSLIKSRAGELTLRQRYLETAVHTLELGVASSRRMILATQKMLREVGEIA